MTAESIKVTVEAAPDWIGPSEIVVGIKVGIGGSDSGESGGATAGFPP